jgi:hypothetical protein
VIELTGCVCSDSVKVTAEDFRSQISIDAFSHPAAIWEPFGEKQTESTDPDGLVYLLCSLPIFVSNIRMVPSELPLQIIAPLGANEIEFM